MNAITRTARRLLVRTNVQFVRTNIRRLFVRTNVQTNFYRSPYNLSRYLFASTTINVPNMGDSISEGTLVEWSKNIGDSCQIDDIVAVIETDKVSIDIRTDYAGVLTEQLANIDDTLEVNAPLFKIDTDAVGNTEQQKPPSSSGSTTPPTTQNNVKQPETPQTINTPPPPPKKESTPPPPSQSSSTPPPPPPISSGGIIDRTQNIVKMSRMRQRISERLMEAQSGTASLTTFNEIDMSSIISLRNEYKDAFAEKHGVKLGFMSAFVKASTSALEFMPAVNAFIDDKNNNIIYNNFCDVAVAVASPTGLVVPVIRNADTLSFAQVEQEIMDYAIKAKTGSLSLQEMTGGTFTISNGGVFGSLFGTPILNPPQSAILGMYGTFEKPIAVNGQVVVKPMMYVALTYDHRIIDGREAVLFLKRIKQCIEDPVRMLLDI